MKLLTAVLSLAAATAANGSSTNRRPWGVVTRGGSDSPAAATVTSIPRGGDAYAASLEAVKTKVLEAANESVRCYYHY